MIDKNPIDQEHESGRNPALIIDIKNALYRAIYAQKAEEARGKRPVDNIVILFRQINNWMRLFKVSSVHIMWDTPRSMVWRKKILEGYKAREKSVYVADISEDLRKSTEILKALFGLLNVRQYAVDHMEADDLIYALVSVLHPKSSVIVSTDSDMLQIPFRFNSCRQFDPKAEEVIDVPRNNPVMLKALKGDKSDHIPGYVGIGDKKATKLCDNKKLLVEHIRVDEKLLKRNLTLIDLSLCPFLLKNTLYTHKVLATEIKFDRQEALNKISEYKIRGMLTEFNDLIAAFQHLK